MSPQRSAKSESTPRERNGHARHAVTASSKLIKGPLDTSDSPGLASKHRATSQKWQSDAYAYVHAIGEVKQSILFLANTIGLARLFIGIREDGDDADPVPAPPGTVGLFEANDVLDRLRDESGSHSWLLWAATMALKIAGEYWVVGYPAKEAVPESNGVKAQPAQSERWAVHSVREFQSKGDWYEVKETAKGMFHPVPAQSIVARTWTPDPEWGSDPDSALRSMMAEMEELLILSRSIRAAGTSRFATAGIFVYPDEFELEFGGDPANDEDTDGEGEPSFGTTLMEVMKTAIANEGDAAAMVPVIIRGPADHADKPRLISLSREMDKIAGEQRKELLDRLGHGADLPIEQVRGMSDTKYLNGYLVDQLTWGRYGNPTVRTIVDSLTARILRPILAAGGLSVDGPAGRLVVWFDPADAIVDTNKIDTAFKAHDRLLISDDTARTEAGYSDADAITDADEMDRRVGQGVPVSQGTDGIAPPNDGAPAATSRGRDAIAAVRRMFTRATPPVPRPTIGMRLLTVDRTLRTQLIESADASMLRALERAGARVRSTAQADAAARRAVQSVSASLVPMTLGAEVVAGLGFAETADLIDDSFTDLQPRFDARVRAAQKAARLQMQRELDLSDAEIDGIERRQDQDRAGAWLWLAGAMGLLAQQRLYDPNPAAPQVGEFDPNSRVPAGLIREAMTRAGGGLTDAAGVASNQPPGGVALGELILGTFARHGQIVTGWEWVYGDPASRLSVFEGHYLLDGMTFTGWDDPVLAVAPEDDWVSGKVAGYYSPGDHEHDQCDVVPFFGDPSELGDLG